METFVENIRKKEDAEMVEFGSNMTATIPLFIGETSENENMGRETPNVQGVSPHSLAVAQRVLAQMHDFHHWVSKFDNPAQTLYGGGSVTATQVFTVNSWIFELVGNLTETNEDAEIGERQYMTPAIRKEMIRGYEEQFGIASEEFLKRWENGTAPDTFETNHWARLLQRR